MTKVVVFNVSPIHAISLINLNGTDGIIGDYVSAIDMTVKGRDMSTDSSQHSEIHYIGKGLHDHVGFF